MSLLIIWTLHLNFHSKGKEDREKKEYIMATLNIVPLQWPQKKGLYINLASSIKQFQKVSKIVKILYLYMRHKMYAFYISSLSLFLLPLKATLI